MSTKPFKDVNHGQKNALATRKWVARFLSRVLGKLNITGQGIKIIPTGDGHLHFEVDASAATDGPFVVNAVTGGFQVSPGLVYSTSTGWQVPRIAGVALDAATPPTLAWSADTALICLVAKFNEYGQATDTPWTIRAFSSAQTDTTVQRANGLSSSPRAGTYHILIASRSAGIITQWVRHNMIVNLQWEQLFVWG